MRCRPLGWFAGLSLAGAALLGAAGVALAQPNCDFRRPQCGDDTRCQPPQNAPRPPQNAPQNQPPGAFVAPPQSGVVQGASQGYGVRGMELEFPALRLRMPTLHFPSMFATRDNPRMLLDAAHAPYVQGNFAAFPTLPAYGGQPQQSPQPPSRSPEPEREPEYNPPMQSPRQAPSCQATSAMPLPSAERLAIEERLRALEETERRLAVQMQQLIQVQRQLAAMEAQRLQQPQPLAAWPAGQGQPLLRPVEYQAADEGRRPTPIRVAPDVYVPREGEPLAPETVSRLPRVDD